MFSLISQAMLDPLAALRGMREFRSEEGTRFTDFHAALAYEAGRNLAHILTLYRFKRE